MKKLSLLLVLVMLFFVMHCSEDNVTSSQENVEMGEVVFDEADADVYQGSLAKGTLNHLNEIRLKYFAKAIAITLKSQEIRSLLKEEIGKKFDGDYDVLWEMVKDRDISGKGKFREVVSNRFGKGSFISIDDIESVSLLQISVPVNFEKWGGEDPILVAYTPLTIDDTEWEEVYAYDSEGNEYVLDAKVEPDFPVVVVGINERVDPITKKLRFGVDESSLGKHATPPGDGEGGGSGGGGSGGGGGTTHNDVILDYVSLQDDGEPWTKGSPEIYWLFGNSTIGTDRHNAYNEWTSDNDHSWHHVEDILFEWHEEYGEYFRINFLEEDYSGQSITFTVGTSPVMLSYTIKSDDDNLGSQTFHKEDVPRTIDNPYSTGSVHFVINWNEYVS